MANLDDYGSSRPPFCETVRANGQGEIWPHCNVPNLFEKKKEYGWRCKTTEDGYDPTGTLIGNWNEERYDIEYRKQAEHLQSQFGHNFDTIYNSVFNKQPITEVPKDLKRVMRRHPHAYPSHQPEFDSDLAKDIYNSWATTHRADFLPPAMRLQPIHVTKNTEDGCKCAYKTNQKVCYKMKE